MANEYIRKQYVGGATQTTLNGGIDDNDTTILITSGTGWPSGATPFVATINPNKANEESVLVTRSAETLTVIERGYDNTSPQIHAGLSVIIHSHDAHTDDQANRYVNLQQDKGDVVIHNGVNPINVSAGLAGDGSDDGMILKTSDAAESGWVVERPDPVTVDASAPSVSDTIYRLWYDETLDMLRTSDGSSWLQDRSVYFFASLAARKAALVTPKEGQLAQLGSGILEFFNGTVWQPIGTPVFADATARDAYFADVTVGLGEGVRALTLDNDREWSYRSGEWIHRNPKITISATQPLDPQDGDVWLQPLD